MTRYAKRTGSAMLCYVANTPQRIRDAPRETKILNTTVWIFLLTSLTLSVLAFDLNGGISFLCAMVLAAIALPWSIVGYLYVWQIMHDAGSAWMFATYCIAFATLNGYLLGRALVTEYG